MGARTGAQDLTIKVGIWSGSVALLVSRVDSRFSIPLVVMASGGIGNKVSLEGWVYYHLHVCKQIGSVCFVFWVSYKDVVGVF